jgi:hypothetical protein
VIAASTAAELLALGTENGDIYLWNGQLGTYKNGVIEAHFSRVTHLCFTPDQ